MKIVLFIHLFALVLAYGAVLLVDWAGLWFVVGQKPKEDLLKLSRTVQPIIWLGLIGLIVSGVLLHPHLNKLFTQLKMVLVLIILCNGINLHFVQRAMSSEKVESFWQLPSKLKLWSAISIILSQLAWLGAMIIGFVNTASRF